MIFETKRVPYPTPWKRRFTILPLFVGVEGDREINVAFGFYEERYIEVDGFLFCQMRPIDRPNADAVSFSEESAA